MSTCFPLFWSFTLHWMSVRYASFSGLVLASMVTLWKRSEVGNLQSRLQKLAPRLHTRPQRSLKPKHLGIWKLWLAPHQKMVCKEPYYHKVEPGYMRPVILQIGLILPLVFAEPVKITYSVNSSCYCLTFPSNQDTTFKSCVLCVFRISPFNMLKSPPQNHNDCFWSCDCWMAES